MNDDPNAVDEHADHRVGHGRPLNVLANDTDPEGDTLTVTTPYADRGPRHGLLHGAG